MKKYLMLLMGMIFCSHYVAAQGEQNIWTFGDWWSIDFNTTPPTVWDLTNNPNYRLPNDVRNDRSIVVCDPSGNRLFTVRKSIDLYSRLPDIYDRYDRPIIGTNLLTSAGMNYREQTPTVIPHPGDPNQYFIFYGRNGGLLYSLFDITLNGGLGNVVQGKHNILLKGYNTLYTEAITTIQGCDGVWLIAKDILEAKFHSFKIDKDGINETFTTVTNSSLPISEFELIDILKVSPDGKMMAATFPHIFNQITKSLVSGGVLMYDFEPCSGKLKNERILDKGQYFEGVCFSPDNTKIYVTQNDTGYFMGIAYRYGKIYQYNLSHNLWEDVRASKNYILTNPDAYINDMFCPMVHCMLGDMKIGPDGKIYLLNNHPGVCFGTALAFHIIHEPNNLGLACIPEINGLYNAMNGMGNYMSHLPSTIFLPREIVWAPVNTLDTLHGDNHHISICFKESTILYAPTGKSCYFWNTGLEEKQITVEKPGTYWVRYFDNCRILVDTFIVEFNTLPDIPEQIYGCENNISLWLDNSNGYTMNLYSNEGRNLIASSSDTIFTVHNRNAGSYLLNINTSQQCDTTIEIRLSAYPQQILTITPQDTSIMAGQSVILKAEGSPIFTWWPTSTLDSSIGSSPIASPKHTTRYTATGINEYGCFDTVSAVIQVRFNHPGIPNAFSPNGDGLNDMFKMEGNLGTEIVSFEIFNRYGELVHAEYNANNGWDGNFRGKPADVGVYNYRILIISPDLKQQVLKGDIHLIR